MENFHTFGNFPQKNADSAVTGQCHNHLEYKPFYKKISPGTRFALGSGLFADF
jgi:hypothetical protein